jgi:uncharacterized protein YjbI with pentapeptide repeats
MDLVNDHDAWVHTDGATGRPGAFNGMDLRVMTTLKAYDLSAISAKGAAFYGLDMQQVRLSGANLEGADLRRCNLDGADLRGARLRNARLDGASLTGAILGALELGGGKALPVNLTGASLRDVTLPA